jgi:toxin-antitoxin system PIN domain toxin
VYVVDANVLLYAVNADAPHHSTAREWLEGALSGTADVYLTDLVELAFVRLATHPAIFPRPLTPEQACAALAAWHESPTVVRTPGDMRRACAYLGATGTAGNLVNDAYLAAIAAERDLEIVTFDRDFARFPDARVRLLGA